MGSRRIPKVALIAAQEAGHTIVIATRRPARGSLQFYQELGLSSPSINFNGSYIHHPNDETFEDIVAQIPMDITHEIFHSEITDYLINAVCEYKDHLYVLNEESLLQGWLFSDSSESVKYGAFKETLDNNPSGFILHVKPGFEQEFVDFLRLNFSDIISCRQWSGENENIIEVFKSDSNKGVAVSKVAEYLGFHPEDVIVFGDGDNDIEMFEFAGTGVAMANALDVLKAVSTTTTRANNEGGIAHYLYEKLLK